MIHNFKYAFKTLFRNKMLIFWTFAFPIILGTFFKMAFSDIENNEKLEIIDIAIVDNEEFKNNIIFVQTFKELSDENNKDRLFNVKYVTEEEAKKLLNNNDIIGYLILSKEPKVVVATNGIDETIFKYVIEEISQTEDILRTVEKESLKNESLENENFNSIYAKIYKQISELIQKDDFNIKDISSKNLSYTMIEFYTLIAMTCLYGGTLGMVAINQNLPNMSSQGKRISVSPTNKGKLILSSVAASYVTQLIGLFILFIYTIFILNVDYGDNLFLVILLSLVGSLAGLTFGVAIATLIKASDGTKTGIIISLTMLGCFLSGMMGISMKYIIDKNIPILNKINPANMITDGFYALYYYETLDRYILNLVSLLIFAFIMIMASYISLRRQKYDSI